MPPARRPGRVRRGVALAAALTVLAGCGAGGSPTIADPQAIPTTPHGAPTEVDVCGLVSPADTARVLARSLRPVGLVYSAARVATLECALGHDVEAAGLRVGLAIGPVSARVFDDAYGEPAGGDPVLVRRLGQAAFMRTEAGQRSLHVLVHGSILTLGAAIDPAEPVGRSALVQLAQAALSKLPGNPELAATDVGRRCSQVPLSSVTAAIGAQPSLFSHFDHPGGAVSCSWASKPGAAVVTVVTALDRVAVYRETASSQVYQRVDLADVGAGVSAASRTDRAGDLLIVGARWAVLITVMPTAGFSNPRITTTPGESAFASAVVAALT